MNSNKYFWFLLCFTLTLGLIVGGWIFALQYNLQSAGNEIKSANQKSGDAQEILQQMQSAFAELDRQASESFQAQVVVPEVATISAPVILTEPVARGAYPLAP